jgi:hypothetical protein
VGAACHASRRQSSMRHGCCEALQRTCSGGTQIASATRMKRSYVSERTRREGLLLTMRAAVAASVASASCKNAARMSPVDLEKSSGYIIAAFLAASAPRNSTSALWMPVTASEDRASRLGHLRTHAASFGASPESCRTSSRCISLRRIAGVVWEMMVGLAAKTAFTFRPSNSLSSGSQAYTRDSSLAGFRNNRTTV